MQPSKCAIAVMAKASVAGRVKTRLAPAVGSEGAVTLNTCFIQDIAANIAKAARHAAISGHVAYSPADGRPFFEQILPAGIGLVPPRTTSFGENLVQAAEDLFAAGHRAMCLVNADSPTLPTAFLVEAARTLERRPDTIVLGPCEDGGYYLIGMTKFARRLFEEIDWSTERVLAQTRARAAEIGRPVHLLPPWYDVDDAAALARLRKELFDPPPQDDAPAIFAAPATRAFLAAAASESPPRAAVGGG